MNPYDQTNSASGGLTTTWSTCTTNGAQPDAFTGYEHSLEWRSLFFNAQEALGVALDHLVALEAELAEQRHRQDALITPAHSLARKFLVEHRRRNASVHG